MLALIGGQHEVTDICRRAASSHKQQPCCWDYSNSFLHLTSRAAGIQPRCVLLDVLPIDHSTATDPMSAAILCCLSCPLSCYQPTQVEEFELPSPKTVCFFVLLSYFFVTAGIAYDIINEPPAIGARQDPVTGEGGTWRALSVC